MKKCPYCAEKIQNDAIVCHFCGKDLPAPIKKKLTVKRILLAAVGLLVLCCVSLLVFGYIYGNTPEYKASRTQTAIWEATYPPTPVPSRTTRPTRTTIPTRTPRPTRTTRPTRTSPPQPTATIVPSATLTATPTVDPSLQFLIDVASLNDAEAETAFDVIQSVGFTRIVELTFQLESEGRLHYLANFGYTQLFVLTIVNNEIIYIGNDNYVFYDISQGGVLDNISNHILTDTEKSTFAYLAQEYVLSSLRAPSTAEFPSLVWAPDQWSFGRDHDIVSVRSWVDAQNSFGAMIRSTFYAQFSYSTEQLLYLVIDNTVVFGTLAEP